MAVRDRVARYRARRIARGDTEWRMRVPEHLHIEAERFRRSILEARGERYVPVTWKPGRVLRLWVTPTEKERCDAFREALR